MKDDKNFHELVRARAHLLWEQEGRPEGKAEEHWRRAASLVESERDAGPAPANAAQTEVAGEDTGARRLRKTPSSPGKAAAASKTATASTARREQDRKHPAGEAGLGSDGYEEQAHAETGTVKAPRAQARTLPDRHPARRRARRRRA